MSVEDQLFFVENIYSLRWSTTQMASLSSEYTDRQPHLALEEADNIKDWESFELILNGNGHRHREILLYHAKGTMPCFTWNAMELPLFAAAIDAVPRPPGRRGNAMVRHLKRCNHCGITAHSKCSDCKKVYYCCREHQVQDWREHKAMCNFLKKNELTITVTHIGL